MNKYSQKILETAYSQYLKSGSIHHSALFTGSANDMVAIRNAIRNLQDDGLIENVAFSGLEASFDLSAIGIEYMCSHREP